MNKNKPKLRPDQVSKEGLSIQEFTNLFAQYKRAMYESLYQPKGNLQPLYCPLPIR
ncbi:hypothetical protein [Spirosoma oryzicola]|uniref:hypothetical protein n=1 Tax=Spirosoma oryzicola TaxID=2898794 RepID=UPI001E3CCFEB|nr:hypothetical protein [Spirosoma oryzicola]UHG90300.1 hypothetical protein LQ777_18855 [Spirosoma oryzicola]